ncbi:helix-turn-helix domain-containing protein [Streptococcus uberis]|uniref:helix-turn-helix domain-containing protein n=1 Tax=Streptococcus uberis TaxID=1349 RepID=UPI0005438888|nr:helix-turn-helix transcriptional regulator [Streptococcus uberis]KHD39832.1 Cro/Cl family transcriptional regulator [Streptococcus hongkongensis]MBI0908056.1 helix-turn-helix transcriptional regulator [Streptococcus uberis]MCK1217387.1 helix-turn-helix domain-containing protein [Streptococcus uberis]SQG45663.1 Helix-turn-helix [Streptococcus uberis]
MNNIEKLIKESGKKLTEISEDTGIAYPTLSGYNQGIRTPKKENAQKLANYFGVSTPYILGLDNNPQILDFTNESIVKGLTEQIKGRKTLDMMLTSTPYLDAIVEIMDDMLNKQVLDNYIDILYSNKYPSAVVELLKQNLNEKIEELPAIANRSGDPKSKFHYLWQSWEKEPEKIKRNEDVLKKIDEQGIPFFKSWK